MLRPQSAAQPSRHQRLMVNPFKVHVRRVDVPVKLRPRLRGHVPGVPLVATMTAATELGQVAGDRRGGHGASMSGA